LQDFLNQSAHTTQLWSTKTYPLVRALLMLRIAAENSGVCLYANKLVTLLWTGHSYINDLPGYFW